MKRLVLVAPISLLVSLSACTSGPTKDEARSAFLAVTTAMTSAQSRAVDDARKPALQAPAQVTVDFSGPCTLGGSVAVSGSYDGDGSDAHAAFDLDTTFSACAEPQGTLDGNLSWTSVADATGFTATMHGSVDFTSPNTAASCDFDLTLAIGATGISYTGSVCGYDVRTELHVGI